MRRSPVIARGVPRQTVDIDGTIWGEALDLDALLATLARQQLVPRIADAREFARHRHVSCCATSPPEHPSR
jgi:hypothetical protein